jgi:DNA mismatch repair protein MutL
VSQVTNDSIQQNKFPRAPLKSLPPEVAERIAAGEVIERPVSVIKELIENALDADAHEIRVELRGGGLQLMRVTDDGCGIPADEIERVCARYTTSKISAVEDLSHLYTLGFRGEALASIAAISEITILSRTIESETDNQAEPASGVTWRGGEIVRRERRARPHGTTVTVRDLFYNVPARLKFVRLERTENKHVEQLLLRYAVGYPSVRFNLIVDEHIALQTGGSGNLPITLTELYHLPLNEMLSPVSLSSGQIHINGYVANRVLAQNNRRHMTLIVNGRWVHSRSLYEALEQGYHNLLPKGQHPILVLYLEVPAEDLDVNVHPTKAEVRMANEDKVATMLTQAVRSVLERSPALPEDIHFPGPVLASQRRFPGPRRRGLHLAESAEGYRAEQAQPGTAEVIAQLRPLAQLQQAVILAEAPDGSLYLVDQHRAHERVIYEHLRRTYVGVHETAAVDAHLLLEPAIIEMKRYQADLLEQRLPMLRGLGIECERFGGRSFLIRSVPTGEGQEQLAAHLHELAEVAAEDSTDWQDHLFIALACRSAMRRGRELSTGEQTTLLKALASVSAPAVCPHGSPILLHYSRTFLIDKFDW